MTLITEILASVTPQVVFAMLGGLIGAAFGVAKNKYPLNLSILLIIIGVISAAAVGDYLAVSHDVKSIFVLCGVGSPVGLFSGFLMDALEIASPNLAKKVIAKAADKGLDRLD